MKYNGFLQHGCALAWLLCGPAAFAAASPSGINGVVELFTSQGCSSCPPADRLLAALASEPDTLALSFSINYWDYIGWKDTLATPEFTARQRAYARGRDGQVYTPEAVIDGMFDAVGSDKQSIEKAIAVGKSDNHALSVPVSLHEEKGVLQIDIGRGTGPAGVYVLRVKKSQTVTISRGENSGRRVTYTNVVRAIHKVGEWDGTPLNLRLPELRGDDEGYVVLLQRGSLDSPGVILAAAKSDTL